MGGRPIRGNEWLSTSGHSACTACHVEMRISFEREKIDHRVHWCFLYFFLVSCDFFLRTYTAVMKTEGSVF